MPVLNVRNAPKDLRRLLVDELVRLVHHVQLKNMQKVRQMTWHFLQKTLSHLLVVVRVRVEWLLLGK
jgi:hypothetical protein